MGLKEADDKKKVVSQLHTPRTALQIISPSRPVSKQTSLPAKQESKTT